MTDTLSATRRLCEGRRRILLALDLPLLRDLLRTLLAEEPDLEVVGEAVAPVGVLLATGQTQADVVILSWSASGDVPGICTHLFAAYPDLLVVGIRSDGLCHYTCRQIIVTEALPSTSLASVLAAIRVGVPDEPAVSFKE